MPKLRLIKNILTSLLYNEKIINVTKKALIYFPKFEEKLRIISYRLKRTNLSFVEPLNIKNIEIFMIGDSTKTTDKQLLFDVSELALRDVHTGIQRVIKALYSELERQSLGRFNLRAVHADNAGDIRYVNNFFIDMPTNISTTVNTIGEIVKIVPGDIFFSADLYMHFPFRTLQSMRLQGLKVIWTIHDLFGLTIPDMLPESYCLAFGDWYKGVIHTADGLVCVSKTIADEVNSKLINENQSNTSDISIGWFHHGANLATRKHLTEINNDNKVFLNTIKSQPILLMVGTLEPRKGHIQALESLEILWDKNVRVNLVFIGKGGWRSHNLIRKLRHHPQRNKQLFWLENASDSLLIELYKQSSALLAASFAEGFGLPLIEAAYYGLPIIARDIPIFHEVAGEYAYYFPNTNSTDLAQSIRQWLELDEQGKAPQSKGMPYLTWEQSTQQLLKVILEDNWYTTFQPNEVEAANKSDRMA